MLPAGKEGSGHGAGPRPRLITVELPSIISVFIAPKFASRRRTPQVPELLSRPALQVYDSLTAIQAFPWEVLLDNSEVAGACRLRLRTNQNRVPLFSCFFLPKPLAVDAYQSGSIHV
jgi:hypothetical protein